MPTLSEFISSVKKRKFPNNGYIQEPGFSHCYVRYTQRLYQGKLIQVIDIANVEAEVPGNGAFKALIRKIRAEYPELGIYVENVLTEKFQSGLLRMGFQQHTDLKPPSFLLLPHK